MAAQTRRVALLTWSSEGGSVRSVRGARPTWPLAREVRGQSQRRAPPARSVSASLYRAAGRGFLKTIAAAAEPNVFAIDVNGEAAGGIGISPGADVERFSAEIGYWLGEPFWGRGITVEALLIVSQYAFETRNLLRLFALPFADNRQSIRVLEKAGYALEGTLRSSSVKSGVIRDQALYALVNTAWKA